MPQACLLLGAVLPRKALTPDDAIELVEYIQHNNHKAKQSHYRRRGAQPPDAPT